MTQTPAARETLAIHGGTPVRATLLPYGRQDITDADIAAVAGVLRSDFLTTGPLVTEFEARVAAFVGTRHAVAFNSGTAALHAAVFAAAIGEGHEAITVPLTFCATSNAVIYQGARPVFADVRPDTLTIDLDDAARRITPRTRAIMPVDYAGQPAELDGVRALATAHGLVVIEDAAHALGAADRGRMVGAISDMTIFSFHPVKHLTTAEGGMLVTHDDEFARRARMFRSHGIDRDAETRKSSGTWHYDMTALGFNYRIPDMNCALGLSQMARLPENLARRRAIAAEYDAAFSALSSICRPVVRADVAHAWHLYPIRVAKPHDRGEVFRALRAEGLGVNVHYPPVHLHGYYRERFGYRGGEYPVAEQAYADLISLPMFHAMTDQDVSDVIAAVTKVARYFEASHA